MKYRYREDIEMKDSGIEWIGKIPKDWTHKKVRNLGDISTSSVDKKINEDEQMIKLVNYVDVYNSKTKELFNHENYMNVSAKQNQISSSNLIRGDVLFTPSSETIHDIGYSVVVMEDLENTLYSYHIVRLRFKEEVDLNFKKYMFWSNSFLKYLSSRATGTTRKTLSINNFKDNSIVMPKLNEQKKIGKFLDEKTSQFDSIISKKEALIKKLEEAKKSLISEVVTGKVKVVKNNDGYELVKRSSGEMKDSGAEWLGEIPKDWQVKKVKHIAFLKSGDSITSENIEEEGTYPVYGGNGLRGYTETYTHDGKYILIGRQGALCGNINYASNKFWASEHAVVVNPIIKVDLIWLGELLRSMNLNQYSISAAQPGLAVGMIQNLYIPYVNIETQKNIAEYIFEKIKNIDATINKTKLEIEKLKEAKQSLISEAVTGKIEILD